MVPELLTSATEAVATADPASLWPPAGALLAAAGLAFKAATTYKEARQIDVDGAKARESEAEIELEKVKKERDANAALYATTLADSRVRLREAEQAHSREMTAERLKVERTLRQLYLLREHMARHGYPLPEPLQDAETEV